MLRYLVVLILFTGKLYATNIDSLENALSTMSNSSEKVDAYIEVAQFYKYVDADKSFQIAEEAAKIATNINYEEGEHSAKIYLADYYFNYGDSINLAENIYRNALKFFQNQKSKKGISIASSRLGTLHMEKPDYDSAWIYFNNAYQVSLSIPDSLGIVQELNNLGAVHHSRSEYGEAMTKFMDGLGISERNGFESEKASLLNDIGLVFQLQQEYDKSLEYYKKSLEVYQKLDMKLQIAQRLNNVGLIYDLKGNFPEAKKHYHQALSAYNRLGVKRPKGSVLNNLGIVHELSGELDSAIYYYKEALVYKLAAKNQVEIASTYINISGAFLKQGQTQKAEEYALKGYRLGKEIGDIEKMASSAYNLYYIKKELNNPSEALAYYEEFDSLKMLIFNQQKAETVQELETKYKTQSTQDSLKLQIAIADFEKTKSNNLLVGLLGLALAALLIGFLYIRVRRQNSEIQRQKNIADTLFDELHHRVGNNLTSVVQLIINQRKNAKIPDTKSALLDVEQRMNTIIKMYHELSYDEDEHGTVVDMDAYLEKIIHGVLNTAGIEVNTTFVNNIDEHQFALDKSSFIGLIVSELVNNSIKHNKGKEDLLIDVGLKKTGDKFNLWVKDNGKGIDKDFNIYSMFKFEKD